MRRGLFGADSLRWGRAVAAAALLLAGWLAGCGPITFVVGVTPGDQRLTRSTVEPAPGGGWRTDRIALIDVSGLLLNARTPGLLSPGENPVSLFREQLNEASRDPRVRAVVLRLNTPGGGVTASDMMYREVERFRRVTGKPVVALMMDLATSGGYYLACSADLVVAYPTTVTGSVGVIVQTISFQRGLERIGVDTDAIVSGPMKDTASPLGRMTPEQRATLQKLVDDYHARFVDVVRTRRASIPPDEFDTVTDGRVFSGEDALRLGLVDQVGDLTTAVDEAKRLAGIDRADLVIFHRPLDHVATPYARGPAASAGAGAGSTQINLLQLNLEGLTGLHPPVGVYYLWRPDLP
jgi:protease-4